MGSLSPSSVEFDEKLSPVGTVISKQDGSSPNILQFSFMINSVKDHHSPFVQHGQYCVVDALFGQVVGIVNQIHIYNNYFHDFATVKNFNLANLNLRHYFPSDEWEIQIAEVQVLGFIRSETSFVECTNPNLFKKIEKASFPVRPGNEVYLLEDEFLRNFIGLDQNGLLIGRIFNHDMPVSINLNRLFNKHVAILAQSGAGKSYLVSVLLEELLSRPTNLGTPGMVLFDLHGEYRFLKQKLDFGYETEKPDLPREKSPGNSIDLEKMQDKIQIINASFLQIGLQDLAPFEIQKFQPNISHAQLRELRTFFAQQAKKKQKFALGDIIQYLNEEESINSKVRDTLIGWLEDLNRLKLFTQDTNPDVQQLVQPGRLTIIDFSSIISSRKKEILIYFLTSKLFYLRRINKIAPFILFLEEAHNFLPESGGKEFISKSIFETIAREGRKFFAQLVLISQRPVRLSTTALSQCNTHIVMRITNPYDLNHIKASSEALTSESVKIIASLPTGNALIMGAALNYPIFTQIRKRKINQDLEKSTLETISLSFMKLDYAPSQTMPKSEDFNESLYSEKLYLLNDYLDEKVDDH